MQEYGVGGVGRAWERGPHHSPMTHGADTIARSSREALHTAGNNGSHAGKHRFNALPTRIKYESTPWVLLEYNAFRASPNVNTLLINSMQP